MWHHTNKVLKKKEINNLTVKKVLYLDMLWPLAKRVHGVWKSQKKSHSTLRAKRATYTFRVDKSSLKMPKMVHFGEFLKTWRLWSNSVTRHVTFNRTKIGGKCQNTKTWNATFLVIFKHCGVRKCVEPTKESAFATNRKFQHPKNKLSDTFYSTFVI